jgi:hypothetical protein
MLLEHTKIHQIQRKYLDIEWSSGVNARKSICGARQLRKYKLLREPSEGTQAFLAVRPAISSFAVLVSSSFPLMHN